MKFMEYGIECSIPYGNGAKYDFIADVNGELLKIQCKSSSAKDKDSFCFSAISQTTNTQKTTRHRYTKNEIDYFATSFDGQVYLVPVEECSSSKTLRFSAPNNNSNYNNAFDYQADKILQEKYGLEILKSEDYNKEMQVYYCIKCNKNTVSKENGTCRECANKANRVVERPSREELKNMIRNIPFTQIAEDYGVSDKAITKWCKTYNLPSRKGDIKQYSDEEWSNI
jgi:hypothetical protein